MVPQSPWEMLREFKDKSDVVWLVWDVYPTSKRDPSQGWLCFESAAEKQRVSPVPPEWESWTQLELEENLERAKTTARTSTTPPRGQNLQT